jgi:hypothetical protein
VGPTVLQLLFLQCGRGVSGDSLSHLADENGLTWTAGESGLLLSSWLFGNLLNTKSS